MTTRTQETIRLAEWMDELERLARAATPGPWIACGGDQGGCSCGTVWAGTGDVVILWANSAEFDSMGEGPAGDQQKCNQRYIAAVDPPTVLALLAVVRDVAINHRPYTTVGVDPGTVICPCCSDLEAGEVVLWEDCPHRPAVDALIALVGSRA